MFGSQLIVIGPATSIAAFHVVPRRLHRLFDDLLVVAFIVMGIVAPDIDSTGRIVLFGIAIILAFITWKTDYSKRTKAPATNVDRSEQFGRSAGRLTGSAISSWKNRSKPQ